MNDGLGFREIPYPWPVSSPGHLLPVPPHLPEFSTSYTLLPPLPRHPGRTPISYRGKIQNPLIKCAVLALGTATIREIPDIFFKCGNKNIFYQENSGMTGLGVWGIFSMTSVLTRATDCPFSFTYRKFLHPASHSDAGRTLLSLKLCP